SNSRTGDRYPRSIYPRTRNPLVHVRFRLKLAVSLRCQHFTGNFGALRNRLRFPTMSCLSRSNQAALGGSLQARGKIRTAEIRLNSPFSIRFPSLDGRWRDRDALSVLES